MDRIVPFLLALVLISCTNTASKTVVTQNTDAATSRIGSDVIDTALTVTEPAEDSSGSNYDDEMATRFVVVADTGFNYFTLRDQLLLLHDSLQQPIDTLGRTYNKTKDLIALPEDDEDEMYAGEYFPR